MKHKIGGCCSVCDAPCFEVMARWDDGEKRAGEPKQFGPPNDDTIRITFMLFNGNVTDMTFCGNCAKAMQPAAYTTLWNRNLAGYLREQDGDISKFEHEFCNGLLCELKRETWKEIVRRER